MVAFSALLTFLKLLSVLSNSESTRNISDYGFLCINQPPEMETYSDKLETVVSHIIYPISSLKDQ